VETGEAELGFAYKSDLKVSGKAKLAFAVPSTYHDPIVYPAAVVKGSKQPKLAAKLIAYLKSEKAQGIFTSYGFKKISQ
jgi:molybdate transport system substrate-binding protein